MLEIATLRRRAGETGSLVYPHPQLHRDLTLELYFVGMANLALARESGRIHISQRYPADAIDSTFIPTTVISNRDVGPGPKLVYARLLACAATNEPATNNRLAADLAISPRSVRNYIAALKAAGLIEVDLQPGKPRSIRLVAAY
jgi:biotin operon repressor